MINKLPTSHNKYAKTSSTLEDWYNIDNKQYVNNTSHKNQLFLHEFKTQPQAAQQQVKWYVYIHLNNRFIHKKLNKNNMVKQKNRDFTGHS